MGQTSLCAGIDIGSKTIKGVVLQVDGVCNSSGKAARVTFHAYRPHKGRTAKALRGLLADMLDATSGRECELALTGSGAIGLAEACGARFVQEVVATKHALGLLAPGASAAIELGGEDAKVLYANHPVQQRMNTSCAGGTGSYLEDVAALMGVEMAKLDELAGRGIARYQIASRCAVFALRDLKPLLASGANRANLATSVYAATVDQTLATLCAGRRPEGRVAFLGGPMAHLPHLVEAFAHALGLAADEVVVPEHAQLAAAIGAALVAAEDMDSNPGPLHSCQLDVSTPRPAAASLNMTGPESARDAMVNMTGPESTCDATVNTTGPESARDATVNMTEPESIGDGALNVAVPPEGRMPWVSLAEAVLPLYAGFDAGSTTVKMAVVDSEGHLAFSRYNANPKDSAITAHAMWQELDDACSAAGIDASSAVKRIATCGYGEDMLAKTMGAQDIVAETTAHCRGALEVFPNASFILDIGGQDMKALWIEDGELADTALNETCSSGCGAFMSSAATALGMTLEELDEAALAARHPIELGARCTVFMRSRIRAAQEQQADIADIAAGAAYAVASNACRRLIGPRRMNTLGDFVVVQGGAFASDAVLAAFEAELGRAVHRSEQGPLMGAIGAALIARDRAVQDEWQLLNPKLEDEQGFDAPPNVVAYQQELLASYRGFAARGNRGSVRVGLACSLGDYEALPFWHATLRELGFSVVVPGDCAERIPPSDVAATLPSDMVCMPARLMHKRVLELVAAGATCVLCPSSDEAGTCPVTREYQDVLPAAMLSSTDVPIVVPKLGNFSPRAMNRELVNPEPLRSCLESLLPAGEHLSMSELDRAVRVGQAEYRAFVARVQGATQDALDWVHADTRRHGIVMSGAVVPYRPRAHGRHRPRRARAGLRSHPAHGDRPPSARGAPSLHRPHARPT